MIHSVCSDHLVNTTAAVRQPKFDFPEKQSTPIKVRSNLVETVSNQQIQGAALWNDPLLTVRSQTN